MLASESPRVSAIAGPRSQERRRPASPRIAPVRLIYRCAEFRPRDEIPLLPRGLRGLYVLLRQRRTPRASRSNRYDVVYVGIAGTGTRVKAGIKGRLRKHAENPRKADLWTHFSVYEVWPNVRAEEIRELEGLFRHIYRQDTQANRLNVQRAYKPLSRVRNDRLDKWE